MFCGSSLQSVFSDQQYQCGHWHHMGTCWKCKFLNAILLTFQKLGLERRNLGFSKSSHESDVC